MAIITLSKDNLEKFKLTVTPPRTYSSSSTGATGSVNVFARASTIQKEVFPNADYPEETLTAFTEDGLHTPEFARTISAQYINWRNSQGVYDAGESRVSEYVSLVNQTPSSPIVNKQVDITRFTPGFKLDKNFLRKGVVQNTLFPYYRNIYPSCQWTFSNYHCLNFFTSSAVPSDSVIVYPTASGTIAFQTTDVSPSGTTNFMYQPDTSFTFDFYICPRYTSDVDQEFKAGTLFHLTSSYAVSLVSGSSRGLDQQPDGFRIMLQLSHSADVAPSLIDTTVTNNARAKADSYLNVGEGNGDLIFVSSDNALKLNKWHHVAIRWGGEEFRHGTGSFVIDGVEDTTFQISSASVMMTASVGSQGDPDALFVGNYYEGNNQGVNQIAYFFNSDAVIKHGTIDLFEGSSIYAADPSNYSFTHPLNAEVHDLKIFSQYRNNEQILTSTMQAIESISAEPNLLFYVPPFFTRETKVHDVLLTPFQVMSASTNDPFNVALSFGVGGHDNNLENYTRELVYGLGPRLMSLTASENELTISEPESANSLLFSTGSFAKRNMTVLPCDNGNFRPNFELLASGNTGMLPKEVEAEGRFVDDWGNLNYAVVSLRNLVTLQTGSSPPAPTSGTFLQDGVQQPLSPPVNALVFNDIGSGVGGFDFIDDGLDISGFEGTSTTNASGTIMSNVLAGTPEDPANAPGNVLTVLQRTRDTSSNEVVFFDISNLFYGDRIVPNTFLLKDSALTGSGGKVKITLRDDGRGGLYRADCSGSHAKWATVGNVIYEEGIAVVKTPVVPLFGESQFNVEFQGERNVHVLEINIPCPRGVINSSSNPDYKALVPTDLANETADEFVYITSVNLHDENFNVVGRVNLSQPLVKRDTDKFLIRARLDY